MNRSLPRPEYHELLGFMPSDSHEALLQVLGEVFDLPPELHALPAEEILTRSRVEVGQPWLATERALLQRQFVEMRNATKDAFSAEIDRLEQLFAEDRMKPYASRRLYQRGGEIGSLPMHWCFEREILLLDRIDQYFFAEAATPILLKGALCSLGEVAHKPSPAGKMRLINSADLERVQHYTAERVAQFMPLWGEHLVRLGASDELQESASFEM